MMVSNKRPKGRGSIFQRGNSFVGRLPRSARPPHQVTGSTEVEVIEKLDAILDGLKPYTIYLPEKLGEDATAKATENDTTLSRVVEPWVEEWVGDSRPEETT